jgi:hypothetical protein
MRKLMRCENDFLAIGLLRSHMIKQHYAALARIFSLLVFVHRVITCICSAYQNAPLARRHHNSFPSDLGVNFL